MEVSLGQGLPEVAIIVAGRLLGGTEQAVMVAADLIQAITRQGQEIGVGRQYGAGRRKFDNRLRGAQGGHDGAPVGRGFRREKHNSPRPSGPSWIVLQKRGYVNTKAVRA